MSVFDRICWPASPNFVKHSCFKAWYHDDQLSVTTSRTISMGVAAGDAIMMGVFNYKQLSDTDEIRK
jgi:hypothetical protein